MCNLYRMRASVDELARAFGRFAGDRANLPAYDAIYPDREAPVLRRDAGELVLERMTWGVPGFGQVKRPITNVRNLDSRFWQSMLRDPARRCLVPVTEFCEWEGEPGSKVKVWFALKAEPVFAFAGIWRPTDDGDRMAFLTTEANQIVGAVHPKAMPVILSPGDHRAWLEADWPAAEQLVGSYPDEAMEIRARG